MAMAIAMAMAMAMGEVKPRGCFPCGSISSFRFVFSDLKRNALLVQSKYAISDRKKIDLRIR